jgi:hypothetical protein
MLPPVPLTCFLSCVDLIASVLKTPISAATKISPATVDPSSALNPFFTAIISITSDTTNPTANVCTEIQEHMVLALLDVGESTGGLNAVPSVLRLRYFRRRMWRVTLCTMVKKHDEK